MSRIILKFNLDPLQVGSIQKVETPAEVYSPSLLDIQFQTHGTRLGDPSRLVIWVETDSLYLIEKKTKEEEFLLRFTGERFEEKGHFIYIKTLEHHNGLIYHIYKRLWNIDQEKEK